MIIYLDGLTVNNVILNIVFVISGLAHALVDGLTLFGSLSLADECLPGRGTRRV